jgi:hypothetical protein
MVVDLELTDVQPINFSVNNQDHVTDAIDFHFKNRTFLNIMMILFFQPLGFVEADTTDSYVFSAGNATFSSTHECFEMEV